MEKRPPSGDTLNSKSSSCRGAWAREDAEGTQLGVQACSQMHAGAGLVWG